MPARILGTTLIVDAIRDYIWSRRSAELVSLSLKSVDEGEWQVPSPDSLASRLPQVVVQYQRAAVTRDKPRKAIRADHQVTVHYLRLLADTEAKGVLVRQQAELIFNLFAQGSSPLPGYTPSALTKVLIEDCAPTGFELEEGFLLDDLAEVEHVSIPLSITAMSHDA